MDLYAKLNPDQWSQTDPDKHNGFVRYTLVRPQLVSPGIYRYYIREIRSDDVDCKVDMVTLEGANGSSDPLASIRNCELIIRDGFIVGVNLDGECVVKKSS